MANVVDEMRSWTLEFNLKPGSFSFVDPIFFQVFAIINCICLTISPKDEDDVLWNIFVVNAPKSKSQHVKFIFESCVLTDSFGKEHQLSTETKYQTTHAKAFVNVKGRQGDIVDIEIKRSVQVQTEFLPTHLKPIEEESE